MLNDIETVLVSEKQIEEICDRIANDITNEYKNSNKKLVLVCILKGSLMFCCEIFKRIPLPAEIEFMKVSSYGASTVSSGSIQFHLDIARTDLKNTDIIIIEDIVDSGRTLKRLVEYLEERGAENVKTCTLLDKPDRRVVDVYPDWCGTVIPDKFVVGFGLDYNEKYRNLPFVGVLKPSVYEN